jgi:hypothetical protein
VNCGALPDSLFESAFFGHVKGAFAGALKDNPGRFEVADAGTLFLGEIGDVPLATYRMAETISNRGLGRGEALSIGRLTRNGTRFSARSLLCPRLDSEDPPDAQASLSRTIRQHPGRSSRPLADRLRLDGLPSPSLSHSQKGLRRATPERARLPRCTGNQAGGPDLHFRINERFLYEYDFGDLWQHQVRIENRLEVEASRSYPVCVGGQWAGPPEDCGGPQAFLDRRAAAPWRVRELLDDLLEDIKAGDTEALDYRIEELQPGSCCIDLTFDRRRVNRRLRQYAEGAPEWMNSRGGRH